MDNSISAPLFAVSLFLGMLVFLELGRHLGFRRLARHLKEEGPGFGQLEGVIFALFGLLVAFTFSGAASRFDSRRQLIADEANAIGTAYLRLELLTPEQQTGMRELFRQYVDSRLEVYRRLPDVGAALTELSRSNEIQKKIWSQTISISRLPGAHPDAAKMILPALNEMFDITTTRTMAARIHPPQSIYWLLFALGLGCALVAGVGMSAVKSRSWFHMMAFAALVAVVAFVILDIEYPRTGFVRLSAYDQVLVELRDGMK